MKSTKRSSANPKADAGEGSGSPPSRVLQLRLLMEEREVALRMLAHLDYAIWALEEQFRNKAPSERPSHRLERSFQDVPYPPRRGNPEP
jgi:hypothetical protein